MQMVLPQRFVAWELCRNLVPLSALPSVYANDSSELVAHWYSLVSAAQVKPAHIFLLAFISLICPSVPVWNCPQ